jgi:hypothetical protein
MDAAQISPSTVNGSSRDGMSVHGKEKVYGSIP